MSYYRRRSTGSTPPLWVMGILLVITLIIVSFETSDQKQQLTTVIEQKGGQVVNIDERDFFTGPFSKGKYDEVYKITYIINGQSKEAWAKFDSSFLSDELIWNWDYIDN